jgi:hypothetical protein
MEEDARRFDMQDRYQVFPGSVPLGILQRPANVQGEHAWQWHINAVSGGGIGSGGWCESREAAMAAFRAAWDRWLSAIAEEVDPQK